MSNCSTTLFRPDAIVYATNNDKRSAAARERADKATARPCVRVGLSNGYLQLNRHEGDTPIIMKTEPLRVSKRSARANAWASGSIYRSGRKEAVILTMRTISVYTRDLRKINSSPKT